MAESITLTAAATAAVQFLAVLDSGETLSAQQLTDALNAANNILSNWTNEQVEALTLLIQEQIRAGGELVAKQTAQELAVIAEQTGEGLSFIANLSAAGFPLVSAYSLAGGAYTAAAYAASSFNPPAFTSPAYAPGTIPQFPDTVTAINVPNGYSRALKLALSVELGPQYDVQPSAALLKQLAEARAAASPMPNRTPVPGAQNVATSPEEKAA